MLKLQPMGAVSHNLLALARLPQALLAGVRLLHQRRLQTFLLKADGDRAHRLGRKRQIQPNLRSRLSPIQLL